jgi:hypothetical protein
MIIAEASRRICSSRGQQSSKPGKSNKFIFKFTLQNLTWRNFYKHFISKFQNVQKSITFNFSSLNTQGFFNTIQFEYLRKFKKLFTLNHRLLFSAHFSHNISMLFNIMENFLNLN